MKTLALTIQFEDSVELRSVRQLIEGTMASVAGFRACKVMEPPPVMPLQGGQGALVVRMDFLSETQAQHNHGQCLAMLAQRGGLDAAEAVALNHQKPYRPIPVPDALQALLHCAKPLSPMR